MAGAGSGRGFAFGPVGRTFHRGAGRHGGTAFGWTAGGRGNLLQQRTEGAFRLQVGLDVGDQDGVVAPLFTKSTERLLAVGIDGLEGFRLLDRLHPHRHEHVVAVVDALCLVSSSGELRHPAAVRMAQDPALLRTIHTVLICGHKQKERDERMEKFVLVMRKQCGIAEGRGRGITPADMKRKSGEELESKVSVVQPSLIELCKKGRGLNLAPPKKTP